MSSPDHPHKPLPRCRHVTCQVGTTAYVWGGQGQDLRLIPATSIETFNGLWKKVETTGECPSAVDSSAAAAIGSTLYHYGDRDEGGKYSNSLHSIQVGEWAWGRVEVKNPEKAPRPSADCGMVACGDQLIVVAGLTDKGLTNELKVFRTGEGECVLFLSKIIVIVGISFSILVAAKS